MKSGSISPLYMMAHVQSNAPSKPIHLQPKVNPKSQGAAPHPLYGPPCLVGSYPNIPTASTAPHISVTFGDF